jgi:hypothetical protein
VNFDKIERLNAVCSQMPLVHVKEFDPPLTLTFTEHTTFRFDAPQLIVMSSGNQDITTHGTLRITGSASFTNLSGSVPSASGGFAGTFFINTSGNINIGDGSDSLDVGTGSLEIQAGTVNVFGQLKASGTGTFTMSGGQVRIDPQDSANLIGTKNTVEFVGAATVLFTGGTATISIRMEIPVQVIRCKSQLGELRISRAAQLLSVTVLALRREVLISLNSIPRMV